MSPRKADVRNVASGFGWKIIISGLVLLPMEKAHCPDSAPTAIQTSTNTLAAKTSKILTSHFMKHISISG